MQLKSSNYIKINVLAVLCFLLISSCSFKPRYGYDRNIGAYIKPKSLKSSIGSKAESVGQKKNTKSQKSVKSASVNDTSTKSKDKYIKAVNPRTNHDSNSLEAIIKPWMGTPYKYGGTTMDGVDCSGFVSSVIRDWKGVSIPRTTSDAWNVGSSVRKSKLKRGDVVYFGNFWGVNHSGIYLGNNIFVHASSSKGVIKTNLDDKYWDPKYKGARSYQ